MSKESTSDTIQVSWVTLTKLLINKFPTEDVSFLKMGKSNCIFVCIENSYDPRIDGQLDYDLDNQIAFNISPNWLEFLYELKACVEYGITQEEMDMAKSISNSPYSPEDFRQMAEMDNDGGVVGSGYDFIRDRYS